MAWTPWLALGVAVASLLLAGAVFWLCKRLEQRVTEPIELRRQVMEFDQLLTEHDEKLRAYYARQRKRDKSLTAALADGTLPADPGGPIADVLPLPLPDVDTKQELRRRARAQGLL